MYVRTQIGLAASLCLALSAASTLADVWDVQFDNDNQAGTTDNELVHGTNQIHDLAGTADNDYYVIGQKPYSSYEVVVDSGSGDFGSFGPIVSLVTSDGTTIVHESQPVSPGRDYSRSLRWVNSTASDQNFEYVRVFGEGCPLDVCDANDQYHIRAYETTTSIARFNNSGTQVTVLMLHNPASYPIDGFVYYWNSSGGLITSETVFLAPKALLVIPTVGTVPSVSGSITVAHNGRYGDLKGKAVALEPSTGFAFDTLMESRPR